MQRDDRGWVNIAEQAPDVGEQCWIAVWSEYNHWWIVDLAIYTTKQRWEGRSVGTILGGKVTWWQPAEVPKPPRARPEEG